MAAVRISALLTALYTLPLSLKAFMPGRGRELADTGKKNPPAVMGVPVILLTALIILFGVVPQLVVGFISNINTV